ncbi:MAG TPA: PP2C family protein-serine/threonine phosphatase, partial [Pseudonocardiaceae bacterium]
EALLAAAAGDPDLGRATVEASRVASGAVSALAVGPDGEPFVPRGDAVGAPSTTYVSAVVTDQDVVVGWVGDSRAYWIGERPGLLTTDHALGGVLTRWLGADAGEITAQVSTFRPDGPGAVLVCSDGLWNYLPEPQQLAEVALSMARTDPAAAAAELTRHALDAGGRDNITVVVVPYPPEAPA